LIVGVPLDVIVVILFVTLLFVSVFVLEIVGTVTPSTDITPADTLAIVVSDACPSSIDPTQIAVDVEATSPAIGNPVQLVSVPLLGVPSTGVVSVGDVSVLLVSVSVFATREIVPVAFGKLYVLLVVARAEKSSNPYRLPPHLPKLYVPVLP